MLKPDDLVDTIMESLFNKKGSDLKEPRSAPAQKVFLSEYEIKRMLVQGAKELKVPANSIVSPLAMEWLEMRGIKITRE